MGSHFGAEIRFGIWLSEDFCQLQREEHPDGYWYEELLPRGSSLTIIESGDLHWDEYELEYALVLREPCVSVDSSSACLEGFDPSVFRVEDGVQDEARRVASDLELDWDGEAGWLLSISYG